MKRDSINIRIKNNTGTRVPIQILGGNSSTEQSSDKNTLVSWDLSGEDFTFDVLTLTTTPEYSAILAEDAQNISGVVNALNSFNVATFYAEGTTIYAVDLLNSTVATANIEIDNLAWDIEGWSPLGNDGQDNYVIQLINAQWSDDGTLLFMGDSSTSQQDRYTVTPTAWLPSDINVIDQTNVAFTQYAVFGNGGQYRYKKTLASSTWERQTLGTDYDLTSIGAVNESIARTGGDWMHFAPDGINQYGITGNTIFHYVASTAWSLLAPASTSSTNVNTFLPADGLALKGVMVSADGTRGFVFKEAIGSPYSGKLYQVDLSTAFDFATASYEGVVVDLTYLYDEPIPDIQFRTDGKRFFTSQDDGLGAQLFQDYG